MMFFAIYATEASALTVKPSLRYYLSNVLIQAKSDNEAKTSFKVNAISVGFIRINVI
jgi:hypothetical protein